jgi:hypothetical protein
LCVGELLLQLLHLGPRLRQLRLQRLPRRVRRPVIPARLLHRLRHRSQILTGPRELPVRLRREVVGLEDLRLVPGLERAELVVLRLQRVAVVFQALVPQPQLLVLLLQVLGEGLRLLQLQLGLLELPCGLLLLFLGFLLLLHGLP